MKPRKKKTKKKLIEYRIVRIYRTSHERFSETSWATGKSIIRVIDDASKHV